MKNFLKYIIPAVIVGVLVSGVAVAQVTNPNFFKLIGNTIQPILNSYGFKVGNFTVDTSGNATTSNLSVTGTCTGCGVQTSRAINTTAPLQGGGDLSANRTFSITQASSTANGYLTSTDWNTFNGKQNALGFTPEQVLTFNAPLSRSVNAISLPKASSTADGYLSQSDWSTFNGKQNALTTGNFSESTSSVLTVTGGTGAILGNGLTVQVKQASSTQSGYLSSTDWSTFNGKVSSQWVTNGSNIGYTAGNVGIGTTSPSQLLTVGNNNQFTVTSAGNITGNNLTANGQSQLLDIVGIGAGGSANESLLVRNNAYASRKGIVVQGFTGQTGNLQEWQDVNGNALTVVDKNGNVGIGTTSPSQLLEVNGASIFDGTLTASNGTIVASRSDGYGSITVGTNGLLKSQSSQFQIYGTANIPLYLGASNTPGQLVINANGNVGIGTTAPSTKLFIQNAAGAADIFALASSSGITLMKVDAQGNINVPHIIGNTATPTIATSTGAGATATSTIAGTDLSGLIQVNTQSADTPAASADIVTITFNKAYGTAPYCTIVPANDATWNLNYGVWRYRQSDTTTTIFKIRSGSTPLPATTNAVYAWTYHCVQ